MKKREDYTTLITLALLLSLGILVAFEIYRFREGDRIQNVKAADQAQQIARGNNYSSTIARPVMAPVAKATSVRRSTPRNSSTTPKTGEYLA